MPISLLKQEQLQLAQASFRDEKQMNKNEQWTMNFNEQLKMNWPEKNPLAVFRLSGLLLLKGLTAGFVQWSTPRHITLRHQSGNNMQHDQHVDSFQANSL